LVSNTHEPCPNGRGQRGGNAERIYPLRPFDFVPEAGTSLRANGGGDTTASVAALRLRARSGHYAQGERWWGYHCIHCGPSTSCPKRALRSGRTVMGKPMHPLRPFDFVPASGHYAQGERWWKPLHPLRPASVPSPGAGRKPEAACGGSFSPDEVSGCFRPGVTLLLAAFLGLAAPIPHPC
jgi:hypothetical protein